MNHSEKIDHDAVLRARTMLLGSGGLSPVREVEVYRVLAPVSPLTYLPKLARALVSYGYWREIGDRPDVRLAVCAEAADAARRIDAGEPRRTELLVDVLRTCQHELFRAGRRAEGVAMCEEMAEAGRWGFEQGQVSSARYVEGRLATVRAEEGRHREAAELRERLARPGPDETPADVFFWNNVAWAADLDAAGQRDAALDVFADLVSTHRRGVEAAKPPLALLTWELVHHSRMLDAAGRRAEARSARQEALALLAELARTGERTSGGDVLRWTALFALSGRPAEPEASPGAPAPAFGTSLSSWSPDVREAYVASLPRLEEEVAALAGAARTDARGHLPALVTAQRRLTIRSVLVGVKRGRPDLEPFRPLFDEGVALARRLADLPGPAHDGPAASARALTDRAVFLVADERYGAAYDDFLEVVALLDGDVSPISHPKTVK
ncbi:hypothetical protein [Streptomyces sp. NPDC006551]|uniref:hypothetical protein n=1 Tax=Streptomyces sp. NPDC006551 TaxID=3157178 RepID=UPI0033AF980A